VAGSTWPPDETLIAKLTGRHKELKIVLAPHMIGEEHLQQIEKLFPGSQRYSKLKDAEVPQGLQVLVIDNIGLLSKLYHYATVAYIGGGFGAGIHNTLEAVAHGKPVLFGPNYGKFQEAPDLLACGGGWSHHDATTLEANIAPLLSDPAALAQASEACRKYMQQNLGSTDIILNTIEK
jgi:3-deoxy-D-manno-octulosonic-acid transferase